MKKIMEHSLIKMQHSVNLNLKNCIKIDLYGDSYTIVPTKRSAKSLAKYLRKAAKWVDASVEMVGTPIK
jgi:hypothetical protein